MMFSAVQPFTLLDYPDPIACIVFTPGCNLRCGFCHNPEFVLPEEIKKIRSSFITEETVLRFLKKRQTLLDGVVISGGEPTLWQELPTFLAQVKKLGFKTKLDTNGYRPDMLAQLLADHLVDYVAMDVKTTLAEYPTLTGPHIKGALINESIALLKQSTVPYEFRSTLIREHHTSDILDEMARLVAGAKQVFLQAFRPAITLDPQFAECHPFTTEEMEAIAERFRPHVTTVGLRA